VFRHLLIIDDSDSDLLYGRLVVERAGVAQRVSTQEGAKEALAFLQGPDGRDVDLILTDINMPGMNGFQFLEAFEALDAPGRARAPVVVMLTSSPDPQDRERAFSFKCVRDYLIKPISVDEARRMAQRLAPTGDER
jgi:CheY-like chemotaxis protein